VASRKRGSPAGALGHRVPRVGGEVDDHRLELSPVTDHTAPVESSSITSAIDSLIVWRRSIRRSDTIFPARAAGARAPDGARTRAGPGPAPVSARRPPDLTELRRQLVRVAEPLGHDLVVTDDHRQHVVDVVRDTAGQAPDRLRFRRVSASSSARASPRSGSRSSPAVTGRRPARRGRSRRSRGSTPSVRSAARSRGQRGGRTPVRRPSGSGTPRTR